MSEDVQKELPNGQDVISFKTLGAAYDGVCEECDQTTKVADALINWETYTLCEKCGEHIIHEFLGLDSMPE